MTDQLKPAGFWRCTGSDDAASRGRLAQVRLVLAAQQQANPGRPARVPRVGNVAGMPHNIVDSSWRGPGFPQTGRDPLAYTGASTGVTEFPG